MSVWGKLLYVLYCAILCNSVIIIYVNHNLGLTFLYIMFFIYFILFYAVLCVLCLSITDNPLKQIFEGFRTKLHILY